MLIADGVTRLSNITRMLTPTGKFSIFEYFGFFESWKIWMLEFLEIFNCWRFWEFLILFEFRESLELFKDLQKIFEYFQNLIRIVCIFKQVSYNALAAVTSLV